MLWCFNRLRQRLSLMMLHNRNWSLQKVDCNMNWRSSRSRVLDTDGWCDWMPLAMILISCHNRHRWFDVAIQVQILLWCDTYWQWNQILARTLQRKQRWAFNLTDLHEILCLSGCEETPFLRFVPCSLLILRHIRHLLFVYLFARQSRGINIF